MSEEYGELQPLDPSTIGAMLSQPSTPSNGVGDGYGEMEALPNELPSNVKRSEFSKDIVPQLASEGEQGFDKAVSISGGNLAWALRTFKGVNPDTAAKVDALAKSNQVPFQMAQNHQQAFAENSEESNILSQLSQKNDDGSFKYPNTAKWLQDPVNMAKSKDDVQTLKQVEGTIRDWQHRDESRLRSGFGSLGQGAVNVFSSAAKGIGTLAKSVDMFGEYGDRDAKDLFTYQVGQFIEDQGKRLLPTNPKYANEWGTSKIPNVLGMTASFMGGGALAGTARAMAGAILGISGTAAGAYDEAKSKGASEQQALDAGTATAPTGLLYAVVPEKILGGMFSGVGGSATQKILTALKDGGAASALFTAQTVMSNAIAKQIYDKDRKVWDGALDSGASGGIGSALASIIVSIATGHSAPVNNGSKSTSLGHPNDTHSEPHQVSPDTLQAIFSHSKEVNDSNTRIQKIEDGVEGLTQLQTIAKESPLAKRDASGFSDFIGQNLKDHNQPESYAVDPKAITDVFLQDAKTPEQQDQAKQMLFKFADDVGIDPKGIDEAIRTGNDVQVNTANLVAKYHSDPVFEAIKKDIAKGIDIEKSDLQSKIQNFQDTLKEGELPLPFRAGRRKLMMDKEAGGGGMTAEEADHSLAPWLNGLKIAAKERGQTLEEHLKENPVELRIGGDGKSLVDVAQTSKGSSETEAPDNKSNANTESLPPRPEESLRKRVLRKTMSGEALTPEEQTAKDQELAWAEAVKKLPSNSPHLKDDDVFKTWKSARNNLNEAGLVVTDQKGVDMVAELHNAHLSRGETEQADRIADRARLTSDRSTDPKEVREQLEQRASDGEVVTDQEVQEAIDANDQHNKRLKSLKDRLDSNTGDVNLNPDEASKDQQSQSSDGSTKESSGALPSSSEGGTGQISDRSGSLDSNQRELAHQAAQKAERLQDAERQFPWLDDEARKLKIDGKSFTGFDDLVINGPKEAWEKLRADWRIANPWKFNGKPLPDILKQGAENPRGAFYKENGVAVIHLFDKADLSTLLHESAGHHLFSLMDELVSTGKASEQTIKDHQAILDFVGSKDGKMTEAQHEKLADAFEKYFMEGKAPSVQMEGAFSKFAQWLTSIYKHLKNIGAPITDEIRQVFDRRLASQDEIKEAQSYYAQRNDLAGLISEDPGVQTELRKKRVEKDQSQEDQMVESKVKAWVKANEGRKGIEKKVSEEVDKQPLYKVLAESAKDKISLESLRENFGEKAAKELAKKYPDLFTEDGTHTIESLAAEHGFESPESLVDSLRKEPTRDQAIKSEVDNRIKIAEQEIRNDVKSSMVTVGDVETHSEKSSAYLIAEAQALADAVRMKERGKALAASGRAERITMKAYRDTAKFAVDRMIVGDATRYDTSAAAERKAGRELVKHLQDGNKELALEARKKQLLNHFEVAEKIKVRSEVEAIQKRYSNKRVGSASDSMEFAFRDPFREILARYGLIDGKPTQGFDLSAKLQALDEDLFALIPDWIKSGESQGDYRKLLTVDKLRELNDTLKAIEANGRLSLSALHDADIKTTEQAKDRLSQTLSTLSDRTVAQQGDPFWTRIPMKTLQLFEGSVTQPQFIMRQVDGHINRKTGKVGFGEHAWSEMIKAEELKNSMKAEAWKQLKASTDVLEKGRIAHEREHGRTYDIPGVALPESFYIAGKSKWSYEMEISLLHNLGNEGNRNAVLSGLGLGEPELKIIMSRHSAETIKAVQANIDLINSFFKKTNEVFFKLNNNEIKKVDASPFSGKTSDGKDASISGYYPLAWDREASLKARKLTQAQIDSQDLLDRGAAVTRTSINKGFTKERVGNKDLPPKLSMDVAWKHIDDVTHYITHAEGLRDLNRIFRDPGLGDLFRKKLGDPIYKATEQWLNYLARPPVDTTTDPNVKLFMRVLDKSRNLGTIASLGLNLRAALGVRHSLFNAMYELGPQYFIKGLTKVEAKNSLFGMKSEASDVMMAKDPAMRHFVEHTEVELDEIRNVYKPGGNVGILDKGLKALGRTVGKDFSLKQLRDLSLIMFQSQHQANVAMIWHGAFMKHMDVLGDQSATPKEREAAAVEYASALVHATQSSSMRAERNALQREQGVLKLFTFLQGWNYKFGSRVFSEYRARQEGAISNKEYMQHVVAEMVLPSMMRLTIASAFAQQMPDWWKWFTSVGETIASPVPVVGSVPKMFDSKTGKFRKNDVGALIPAMQEPVNRSAQVWNDGVGVGQGKKEWQTFLWDVYRFTEYVTGIPASNAAKMYSDFEKMFGKESSK